ncbi:response regulator [uncultured Robinsoniella sp.]|uniref:response regulator n=1 Tax=uncultured Robinsoniella sp. TaxID=904190 RepID=UPI00374E79E1
MYRLLIVDDEEQIREGLKKILPWAEYDIEVSGEAGNGQQALDLVNEIQPHIIFVDMHMPIMGGNQFLGELKNTGFRGKVIVLSGYDDFGLIRQAMRNGAVDYLLKPSSKDEILQIIEEIIASFEDEIQLKLKNSESLYVLKANVLGRLLRENISYFELKQKLELLEINFNDDYHTIAILEIINDGKDGLLGHTFNINQICHDIVEKPGHGIVFIDSIGRVIIILSHLIMIDHDIFIKDILTQIIECVKQSLGLQTVISVGRLVKTYRNFKKSYKEAVRTLEYQYVFGLNNVLFYDEIEEYFENKKDFPKVERQDIRKIIQHYDFTEVTEFMNRFFLMYTKKEVVADRFVLRNCAMEIIILAYQCLDEISILENKCISSLKENALQKISVQNTLNDIKDTVCGCIFEIIKELEKFKDITYSKLVNDTMLSVQEQYSSTELSLQYLADKFHVNSAYLGRIFKKEVNKSFPDYLNIIRIEKAKRLLIDTNYKGSELCKKVGFANYNYFYIVFKKVTGKSPMDFRK